MKYTDFRIRSTVEMFVTFIATLLVLSGIDIAHSAIVWNVSNLGPLMVRELTRIFIFVLPALIPLALYFIRFLGPLHRAFVKIMGGQSLETEERSRAFAVVRRLRPTMVVLTVIAYLLPSLVLLITEPQSLFSLTGILGALLKVNIAVVVSLILSSLTLRHIMEPRRLLGIYDFDEKTEREMGLRTRIILTTLFLVSFVMLYFVYENLGIIDKQIRYSKYLEQVVGGTLDLKGAEGAFKQEGAQILHVSPESIEFPFNERAEAGVENTRSIEALGILALILLVVAYLVQRVVAEETLRQVTYMKKSLDDMLKGSGDLRKRVDITQYDEVGALAASLNKLLNRLQGLFSEIQKAGRISADVSVQLASEIEDTSAVAQEMSASIEQVSRGVKVKQAVVQKASEDLQSVFESLDSITASVDSQAAFVNQTSSAVNEMAANIKSVSQATGRADQLAQGLGNAAQEGANSVNDSIRAIQEIEASSRMVADIVTVISKISAQTNLLAMNAAIEAAHAGDAGRGFAVVAEEVRNLAETSSKSAKEISGHIKEMLSAVKNGVQLSEKAGSSLEKISTDVGSTTNLIREIANAMAEQNIAATEILDSIGNLVNETQSIRQNALEQKERNTGIRQEVGHITEAFAEIVGATEEQAEGSQRILHAVADLVKIEQKNREIAEKLKTLVEGFNL